MEFKTGNFYLFGQLPLEITTQRFIFRIISGFDSLEMKNLWVKVDRFSAKVVCPYVPETLRTQKFSEDMYRKTLSNRSLFIASSTQIQIVSVFEKEEYMRVARHLRLAYSNIQKKKHI